MLVPSQVIVSGCNSLRDVMRMRSTIERKRECTKERRRRRSGAETTEEEEGVGEEESASTRRGGTTPNIFWLHVPEDDLRAHPTYSPLPPPECIEILESWIDVSNFRQDSTQWARLHDGRLTTSRAAGVLGVLEPDAARKLSIPRGLCGSHKARRSLSHLQETPFFKDLDEARRKLLIHCPKRQR